MNNENTNLLNNEENQELAPKKEWDAPALSIWRIDNTEAGGFSFGDGAYEFS